MMQQTDPDYITSGDSLSSRRQSGDDTATSTGPRNKKKRIRNWTEDDRAIHRIFERSRREAFKERLKVGAQADECCHELVAAKVVTYVCRKGARVAHTVAAGG